MKCIACNITLNDYEATRKDTHEQFIDLCNHCFAESNYEFDVIERLDLHSEADIVFKDSIE